MSKNIINILKELNTVKEVGEAKKQKHTVFMQKHTLFVKKMVNDKW